MGKRSDFERRPRDWYPTPETAIPALLPHLQSGTRYIEPAAGDGALIRHLQPHGHQCIFASDLDPQAQGIMPLDLFHLTARHVRGADCVITNPPWDRPLLHTMIEHLMALRLPAWLLIDANWAHSLRAAPILSKHCTDIVVTGRHRWIPDSPHTGKDDCAWFHFQPVSTGITFHPRRKQGVFQ